MPGRRRRQFLCEGGPAGRGGESHGAVERERGDRLPGTRGAGDELADLLDEPRRDGEQPARGQPVR
jgi:hypothetical protein